METQAHMGRNSLIDRLSAQVGSNSFAIALLKKRGDLTPSGELTAKGMQRNKMTAEEIAQLEKNFYSYQAGYLKHLYRMAGYNPNFESYVTTGTIYDTYYIKFNEYDRSGYNWGDYIHEDSMVIIAVPQGTAAGADVETVLSDALGSPEDKSACTTTTTTTAAP